MPVLNTVCGCCARQCGSAAAAAAGRASMAAGAVGAELAGSCTCLSACCLPAPFAGSVPWRACFAHAASELHGRTCTHSQV